jgi:hypothetical protein
MVNGEPELLDVRIVAFPTTLQESPVVGLKRVFGIDEVAASRLLGNLPAVVQRGVPLVRAEYFRRALELIGAEVEIRTRGGALVPVPAPEPSPETAPLVPRERTQLQGAAPPLAPAAVAAPASPAGAAVAPGTPADVTLREPVPAPTQAETARTRVAPRELDLEAGPMPMPTPTLPAEASASDVTPTGPARWADPERALARASARPGPPPALELELPDPPAAVRERRPNARILPGEVPASNPPRGPATRSSRPPRRDLGARRSNPPPPAPAQHTPVFDTRSFWASLGDALALPWLGRGPYWLLALFVWSIFAALSSVIAESLAVPVLPLVIGGLGALTLMGFAADGFRAAFRCVVDGAPAIAQAPSFDPAQVVTRYVVSALHLMLFALLSNVPALLWYFKQAEGVSLLSTLAHPMTWLLTAFPAFYWPAGLATAALHGSFAGIWKVHVGLRAVVLAPLEYLASATLGALALGLTGAGFALLGKLLALPPALGLAALGLALGVSHLLWGSLLGHLWRTQPEAFEP